MAPAGKSAPKQTEKAPAIQPVVILSKPSPAYTDEARKLRIEGEVLVEVIFRASGQVQAVCGGKGLGHGLDGAALHSPEEISSQPPFEKGQSVDFSSLAPTLI